MPTDPGDNMKATEDFLLVVLHSYVVAAAKFILSTEPKPADVATLSGRIVDMFVSIDTPCTTSFFNEANVKKADTVRIYAMELMTLGLLWHNFHDSVKEADGEWLVRVWKFNLLVFKAAGQKNYAIEALNLILQVNYFLSPRQSAQVTV